MQRSGQAPKRLSVNRRLPGNAQGVRSALTYRGADTWRCPGPAASIWSDGLADRPAEPDPGTANLNCVEFGLERLLPGLERRLRAEVSGGVHFDRFTRGRYATDASHYQIMPLGVVAPPCRARNNPRHTGGGSVPLVGLLGASRSAFWGHIIL